MSPLRKGEQWVRSAADLTDLRVVKLAPEQVMSALASRGGALHLRVDPGVGKTTLADGIIANHLANPKHDLLVFATAQTSTLMERPAAKAVLGLPEAQRRDHPVALLQGRPAEQCGPLDAEWRKLEQAGCGALARTRLCEVCPHRATCTWRSQFSKVALAGKKVVLCTHGYLEQLPDLVEQLRRLTGAKTVLVIIDEASFLDTPFRRTITDEAIRQSQAALQAALGTTKPALKLQRWDEAFKVLLSKETDLADYVRPPHLGGDLVAAIQAEGLSRFGGAFRYLGSDLVTLAYSRRWRVAGGIAFVRRPSFRDVDLLILAAAIPLEVVRHRLGRNDIEEYLPGVRCCHADTKVYNLRSAMGSVTNFRTHAPQICYAVAQLIAKLANKGKRSLVVSKKKFCPLVAKLLEGYLRELTGRRYRVVAEPSEKDLKNKLVVPLIWYGVKGTNAYEGFDAAFAVNTYNVDLRVLNNLLNDVHSPEEIVQVEVVQRAGRREAMATTYRAQQQGYSSLAQAYQRHLEAEWAEQALGRCRFTVKPRLVLFFQSGEIRFDLEKEFRSLESLRTHFELATHRGDQLRAQDQKVKELLGKRLTRQAIAARLGVNLLTVQRAVKRLKG